MKRGVGAALRRWARPRAALRLWLHTTRRWWARRSSLGARGEREAARRLRRAGYRVLARNVRVPPGEADIVCRGPDGRTIVLVEVKSRLRLPGQPLLSATVAPEASITRAKLRRMLATARWLAKVNRWGRRPVRLDVVAIEFERDEQTGTLRATWRHHEGVARL